MYDLDLLLHDITGSLILISNSSSSVDKSENLGVSLPAGRNYMLQVIPKSGQSSFTWNYALAWRVTVDLDGDVIPDDYDNCPYQANPDQSNFDTDGLGDTCDTDDDNDALTDLEELLIGTNPLNVDTNSDGDGLSDGDEITNGFDPIQSDKGQFVPRGAPDNTLNVADMLVLEQLILGIITAT